MPAEAAGLPVCVHVGWSLPSLNQVCDEHASALNLSFALPLLMGFFSFTGGGILERFPRLRVAFLEAGAGWLPWFVERSDHYHPVVNWFRRSFGLPDLQGRVAVHVGHLTGTMFKVMDLARIPIFDDFLPSPGEQFPQIL